MLNEIRAIKVRAASGLYNSAVLEAGATAIREGGNLENALVSRFPSFSLQPVEALSVGAQRKGLMVEAGPSLHFTQPPTL